MRRVRATIVVVEMQNCITYSECVFVASGIQHDNAHAPYYIAICGLTVSTIFSTLSHKRHYFWWWEGGGGERGRDVIEHKMCVLIFSTILYEIFPILRKTERDIIKNVYRSPCKVPIILVIF